MEALLPLIITFGLMWALLIRPQQRRVRQHQELVSTLAAGDEVITTGGIVGTIASVDDDILTLEVAPDTVIRLLRSAVQTRIAPFGTADPISDGYDALEDAFAEDAYDEDATTDGHPGEPVPGPRDITGVMPVVPPPPDPNPTPNPTTATPPPPPPVPPADSAPPPAPPPQPPPTGEKT